MTPNFWQKLGQSEGSKKNNLAMLFCIPSVYQLNPLWANKPLGNATLETQGQFGCLISCMASMSSIGNSFNWRLDDFNDAFKAHKGFQTGGCPACAATFDISSVSPQVRLGRITPRYPNIDFPSNELSALVSHIKLGGVAIAEVDINLQKPGEQCHFVLCAGVNSRDGIEIMDPWVDDRMLVPMVPRYGPTEAFAIWQAFYYNLGPSSQSTLTSSIP